MDDTGRVLSRAHELAAGFLAGLDERPVWPRATFEDMLAAFDEPLPDEGADPVAVVEELAATADAGAVGHRRPALLRVRHRRRPARGARRRRPDQRLGPERRHQLADPGRRGGRGGRRPLDRGRARPAGRLGRRVRDRRDDGQLLLPVRRAARRARAAPGGTSRSAVCSTRRGCASWSAGYRHDTVDRAVRYLGLGQDSVVEVDTDGEGRISVAALESVLAAGEGPAIVCLVRRRDPHGRLRRLPRGDRGRPAARRVGARRRRFRAVGRGQPVVPAPDRRDGRRRLVGDRRPQDAERALRLGPGDRARPRPRCRRASAWRPTTSSATPATR